MREHCHISLLCGKLCSTETVIFFTRLVISFWKKCKKDNKAYLKRTHGYNTTTYLPDYKKTEKYILIVYKEENVYKSLYISFKINAYPLLVDHFLQVPRFHCTGLNICWTWLSQKCTHQITFDYCKKQQPDIFFGSYKNMEYTQLSRLSGTDV